MIVSLMKPPQSYRRHWLREMCTSLPAISEGKAKYNVLKTTPMMLILGNSPYINTLAEYNGHHWCIFTHLF